MKQHVNEVVAEDVFAPEMVLNGKNHEQYRPPVIADESRARNQVFGKILRNMFPVVDVLVVEDEVIIIPKHLVIERVGIQDKSYEC